MRFSTDAMYDLIDDLKKVAFENNKKLQEENRKLVESKKVNEDESKQPDGIIGIYDNGGKTFDRYTIVFSREWAAVDDKEILKQYKEKNRYPMLGLSHNPNSPQGFSQWCEGQNGNHLGKKINWEDLPNEIRSHIIGRLKSDDDSVKERRKLIFVDSKTRLTEKEELKPSAPQNQVPGEKGKEFDPTDVSMVDAEKETKVKNNETGTSVMIKINDKDLKNEKRVNEELHKPMIRLKRKPSTNEWKVCWFDWKEGSGYIYNEDKTSYHNDKQDAEDTMKTVQSQIDKGESGYKNGNESKVNENKEIDILLRRISYYYDNDMDMPEIEQEHVADMIRQGYVAGELNWAGPKDEDVWGYWHIVKDNESKTNERCSGKSPDEKKWMKIAKNKSKAKRKRKLKENLYLCNTCSKTFNANESICPACKDKGKVEAIIEEIHTSGHPIKPDEQKLKQALELVKKNDWESANELLGGFGVENVNVKSRNLSYINLGDTYDTTVCQEDDGEPFIGNWGDWSEQAELKYEEDNDVIRCSYCSEFTPKEEGKEWRDNVCQSCGHYVDGRDVEKKNESKTNEQTDEQIKKQEDDLKKKMFDKEKKEHSEFSDDQIWKIVNDHLKADSKNESKKINEKYQGWKNYETWAVALHLSNDKNLQDMIKDIISGAKENAPNAEQVKGKIWNEEESVKFNLADNLKNFMEDNNPLKDEASVYLDLINGALEEVDWQEITDAELDKYKENNEAKKVNETFKRSFASDSERKTYKQKLVGEYKKDHPNWSVSACEEAADNTIKVIDAMDDKTEKGQDSHVVIKSGK